MSELKGIATVEELTGQFRRRKTSDEFRSVPNSQVAELLDQDWNLIKENRTTSRLSKPKTHDIQLEDRVWTLMYRMGFTHLSQDRNCTLVTTRNKTKNQIDVFAIDDDIALAIECKSATIPTRRTNFQGEVGKFHMLRESLSTAVRSYARPGQRRLVGLAMFLNNAILSEADSERAKNTNITLFEEGDLAYYEELVHHIGHAARYQFLADAFAGRDVPGLEITIPAVRSSMGARNFFSFSLSPAQLLKIAYVSHRRRGSEAGAGAYQRMMSKSRLKEIRRFVESDDAIFPTNIVLNVEGVKRFEKTKQEGSASTATLGWLTLKPRYRSAWVIDGQHRLFAYADSGKAEKASLTVVAFENLDPTSQAQLFVDINAKQKSVKQALLQELYADLHKDAEDPRIRLRAVISQIVQELDRRPESPFYNRILSSESRKSPTRCIQFNSVYGALNQPDLFVTTVRRGTVDYFGPLYAGQDNPATVARTIAVLNLWFGYIRDAAESWWNLGAGEGGGLAMAGSVVSQIMVLRSVFDHLEKSGIPPVRLETDSLLNDLRPFALANAEYLDSFSEEARKGYRNLFGISGQTARARRAQIALQTTFPEFNPEGLKTYKEQQEAQTNRRATEIVKEIETLLQSLVVRELKEEFGSEESGWWMQGIPTQVRLSATKLYEEDQGSRGGREYYFDLIHYREIARKNWQLLRPHLGFGRANDSRDKQTSWIAEVNQRRREVMHVSSGINITLEQLDTLESYRNTLVSKMRAELNDAEEDDEA
jgi:DGQHR domain-containing protein